MPRMKTGVSITCRFEFGGNVTRSLSLTNVVAELNASLADAMYVCGVA